MGRPTVYLEPRLGTKLRIPTSLHERMVALAAEREVSVNYLYEKAARRYLENPPSLELVPEGGS